MFRCDECTTPSPAAIGKAAMVELSLAYPQPLAFDGWSSACGSGWRAGPLRRIEQRPTNRSPNKLAPIAIEWFAMRLVELRAFEPPMAAEPGERPMASAVARYQVANGWAAIAR